MTCFPSLVRSISASGAVRYALGDPLVDRYLEFVAGRARPNTLRAVAFDLKTFFTVIVKNAVDVESADVFEFLAAQRGDRTVVRLADRESGVSARTIARRLSSVSGLYAYLVARGDTGVRSNPVPRGLATRRQGGRGARVPLVRVPRTLPRILAPAEADRLVAALRMDRDRAMVAAMLLAGLRRCEVLGLRLLDVQVADRRLVITEVNGGRLAWNSPRNHERRSVPLPRFLAAELTAYLANRSPDDLLFTGTNGGVLRNRNARRDWFNAAARAIGEPGLTPHELRHTAASLAVSAGANVKAVQRMLGHASAAMTLDRYADLFDDDLDAVAERLDAVYLRAAHANGEVIKLAASQN